MDRFGLSEDVALIGLRGLKAVAMADGVFEDHERDLVRAAARTLKVEVDVDALEEATPEEVASELIDPTHRERLVQAQLIMAMIDGEISAPELATLKRFAAALDVDEPRLANLRQLMNGHLRYVQFDLFRHSNMLNDVLRNAWRREGLRGVWKNTAPMQGLGAEDPELARKYLALGEYPEGSFGRAYFLHMTERGFTFPGEKKGFPEGFMKHDLCHVLADYDTDIVGETEVIGFISGFYERDPFSYFFMIALHAHLGVEIFQGDATGTFELHPDKVLAALERGTKVNRDLYSLDLDWWDYLPRPLEEVRAEFNVVPKA